MAKPNIKKAGIPSSFVADGFDRALQGFENEIRSTIEMQYEAELISASFARRWLLRLRVEKEIRLAVAERAKVISNEALF